jgi:hypothetical protein
LRMIFLLHCLRDTCEQIDHDLSQLRGRGMVDCKYGWGHW